MTRIVLAAVLALPFVVCGCAEDPILRLSDDLEELDLNTRLTAVAALRDLDDDRAIELLAEALESDEELIDATGNSLAYKGRKLKTDDKPDKVNEALTRIMNNTHLEGPPRAKAAWALGEIADRESIPALKGATSANDAKGVAASDVRTQATEALEKLGYNTRGRAPAMSADGEVPDSDLDGTPELPLPTAPMPKPEAEEEEATEGEEGAEEATDEEAPSETPAPEAGEAEEEQAAEGADEAAGEEAGPATPEAEST